MSSSSDCVAQCEQLRPSRALVSFAVQGAHALLVKGELEIDTMVPRAMDVWAPRSRAVAGQGRVSPPCNDLGCVCGTTASLSGPIPSARCHRRAHRRRLTKRIDITYITPCGMHAGDRCWRRTPGNKLREGRPRAHRQAAAQTRTRSVDARLRRTAPRGSLRSREARCQLPLEAAAPG